MKSTGTDEMQVLPRKTLPDWTSLQLPVDQVLPVVQIKTQEQIDAVAKIANDLVPSKEWYPEEFEASRREYRADAER